MCQPIIEQCQTDQSMENTKLVDLKERFFHSTLEYVDVLKHFIDIPELTSIPNTEIEYSKSNYQTGMNNGPDVL
ncbi:6572_t:CDS:2 [Gigaspora rosea]|nr:6572_t:CDS:2 [Gigaspora rosea]